MTIIKDLKLNREMQKNFLIIIVAVTFSIVFLFNLFWAPMVFMIYGFYIVLNSDRKITKAEMLGLVIIKVFLFYCIVARMYGQGPGIFLGLIVLGVALAVTKVTIFRKGGKK